MDGHHIFNWTIPLAVDDSCQLPWYSNFSADATTKSPTYTDPTYSSPSQFNHMQWDGHGHGPQATHYEPMPTMQTDANPFSCFRGHDQMPQVYSPGPSLPRRRSRYSIRGTETLSRPIAIPVVRQSHEGPVRSLTMQRWQNSPPKDEAVPLSAIYTAVEQLPLNASPLQDRPRGVELPRFYRATSSTTSLESGASGSSIHSVDSRISATSQTRNRVRVAKPRRQRKTNKKSLTAADRIFKCTFCCDTFKHKFDWTRHEKSLHLNMEEWICTPHGATVMSPSTGEVHCVYCNARNPTYEHLQTHNHSVCHDAQTRRIFRRKDHLVQHLRLVHEMEELPQIDDWKVEPPSVTSRCGFCDGQMQSWDERADHLAAHFRRGKTMADWKGDHAFAPDVNARVTHAYPPYMIASQATTIVPFSATNPDSIDHLIQIKANMQHSTPAAQPADHTVDALTDNMHSYNPLQEPSDPVLDIDCSKLHMSDILTRHLAGFAKDQMRKGVMPTDEMFRRESRRIQFNDEDDDWNQTIADDQDWLDEFRQRAGIPQHQAP